jgi:hypothetical protein
MQSIVHAFSKFFDSTDPFRPYTWRLAKTFVSKEPKAVIAAQSVILVEKDYMRKAQGLFIQQLLRQQPWVHEVAEVGFNVGHASWIFLSSRPDVKVTSFTLDEHGYVSLTSDLIDQLFPGRHELVPGNPRLTISEFAAADPLRRFDLIYFDANREFELALANIEDCRALATDQTIVIMDKLNPHKEWCHGPIRAWAQSQDDEIVEEDVLVENGFPVMGGATSEIGDSSKVWALGHYVNPVDREDST